MMKKLFLALLMGVTLNISVEAGTNGQEVQNFVKRFYSEVLSRESEPKGLNDWTNRLTTGQSTGADVATGFVFSAEFIDRKKTNEEFVNILYSAFFDRDADEGGFNGWMSELSKGTSKEDVLDGFLFSKEFTNLCKSYGIKAVPGQGSADAAGGTIQSFVKRFYSVILGREADIGGLKDWVEKLSGGNNTGSMMMMPSAKKDKAPASDIATGFIFSAEYNIDSKNNTEYLTTLYSAFFNRAADEGGFNGWMTQMDNGTSREDVLSGFIHSEEFINLCNGYKIIAYKGAPIYRVSTNTGDDSTTEYTYDTKGNTLIYSYIYTNSDDGSTYTSNTNYTYDENSHMLTYSNTGTNSDGSAGDKDSGTYTYDAKGNILTSTSKGAYGDYVFNHNTTFTYDTNGNLLTVSGKGKSGEDDYSSNSTYTHDAKGNILTTSGTNTYGDTTGTSNSTRTYDANGNQLTSSYARTSNDGNKYSSNSTYTYDDHGNNLTDTHTSIYTDSEGNQDTSKSAHTYTYDKIGNMITSQKDDDTTPNLYAWDSRGKKIIKGSPEPMSPELTVYTYYSYSYDEHNNLISKTENGTVKYTQEWIKVN